VAQRYYSGGVRHHPDGHGRQLLQGRRLGELFWTIVCAVLAAPYVVGQSHSRSNFDVFTLASGGAVSHSYHESFSCVFLAALGLVDVVSVTFYDLVTRFGRPSIIAFRACHAIVEGMSHGAHKLEYESMRPSSSFSFTLFGS
jgi:hypothetical protein